MVLVLHDLQTVAAVEPFTLPAAGIVDLDEFTIEMWVMLAFDPHEQHDGQRNHGFVYEINYGDSKFPDASVHWFTFTQYFPREKLMWAQLYNQVFDPVTGDRLTYSLLGQFPQDATRNSWHHVAVSFRGRTRRMYMNGKEISNSEMSGHFAHPLRSTAVLRLGTNWRHDVCHLAFDEVRISSVVRPAQELGFHTKEPLRSDRFTTLLLNFDEPIGEGQTTRVKPVIAATPAAAVPRALPTGAALIDGKFGKALTFSPASP